MRKAKLNRRDFMRLAAGAGMTSLVAACVPPTTPAGPATTAPQAGTAPQPAAPAGSTVKGTLQIWTYPRTENDAETVYKPMMADFAKEYPGIEPKIDVQPWSGRREKLYAAAAAGSPPDIWWATTDTIPTYVGKGIVMDLTDAFKPEDLTNYSPTEIQAASYKGKLLMPLVDSEVNGFGYNGKLLEQLGYDPKTAKFETWDELYALADKAKAKKWYLESLSTFDWAEWLCTVHEAGGTVFSADRTKALMTEQPSIDALTRWVTEYKNGWVPLEYAVGSVNDEANLPDYWLSLEQVTSRREDGACWRDPESNKDLDYVVGYPRHKTAAQAYIAGLVSGQGWAVTNVSQAKDAAVAWIKWMIKPENVARFNTLAGSTPIGKAKTLWQAKPCQQEHLDRFAPYIFGDQDINTLWQESKTVAGPHFQAAILGKETVEQALEATNKELNAMLAKQG